MAVLLIPSLLSLLLTFVLPGYAADRLALGERLTPSSPPLTSPHGSFTLSLRPFAASTSSSLYLAISFSFSPHGQSAWVANRDLPVSSSSASLLLSSDGSLTLSDSSGVAWSVPNLQVVTVQLLDSGNLILVNKSSAVVWQSFDHPTDTLLPGQRFGLPQQLTSQGRADSFSSGLCTFQLDSTTAVATLSDSQVNPNDMNNIGAIYWTWGEAVANATAAQLSYLEYDSYGNLSLYHSGVVNSSYTASDYGSQLIRRLTLNLDGNLRMYSWNTASARWIRVWLAVENVCTTVRSLCGPYGICALVPEPVCLCPPGFKPVDVAALSQGCTPVLPLNLNNCSSADYIALASTNFPFYDYRYFTGSTVEHCKSQCSSSCNCVAAVFNSHFGDCWLKSQVLNGIGFQSERDQSFLKISGLNQSALTATPDNGTYWSSLGVFQGTAAPAILSVF